MKALATIMLAVAFAAVPLGAEAAPAETAELVAPAYPQAVLAGSGPYSLTYLTNDPLSKVRAFYASHRIQLAKDGSRAGHYSAVVLDQRAVCLAEKASHKNVPTEMANAPKGVTDFPPDAADVAVTESTVPAKVNNAMMIPEEEHSVFPYMKQEVIKEQAGNQSKHTESQLLALYNKYRWIDGAFYPSRNTAKGAEPYNQWLISATQARISGSSRVVGAQAANVAGNEAAVAAHVRQLLAEGKTQEAMQLAKKMEPGMEAGQAAGQFMGKEYNKDRWKDWMDVLKKLKAHAYKTKIVIGKKPGTWPMHNICGM